jgi:rubrerythrin
VNVELTTQQKSRFRRAYRETLVAESHSDAIKAMYARFSELYGVSLDALQALVTAEWKRDPQQYNRLQSQLAARRAAAQGEEKLRRPASALSSPETKAEKSKKNKTSKSKNKQKQPKSKRGRPQASGRKWICPVCRRSVAVADNGCIKGHTEFAFGVKAPVGRSLPRLSRAAEGQLAMVRVSAL